MNENAPLADPAACDSQTGVLNNPGHPAAERSNRQLAAWFLAWFVIFCVAESIDFKFSNYYKNTVDEVVADATDNDIQSIESGTLSRRVGLLALAIYGIACLRAPSGNRLRFGGGLGLAIVVFLGWSVVSLAWSDVPAMTVRKIVAFACMALGALGLAKALTWRQWIAFVFCATSGYLFLGVASEFALLNFRPLTGDYQYTGLSFPAFTAWTFSLLVLAGMALRNSVDAERAKKIAMMVAVATVLLFMARSRTPAAAFVVAVASAVVLAWPPRRTLIAGIALVTLLATGLLVVEATHGGALASAGELANMGRGKESLTDLTGRVEVWQQIAPFIQSRPWLGYGFESFWTPPRRLDFATEQKWAVPDAHNGYINLTLGVGLIGAALYVVCLVLALARALKSCFGPNRAEFSFVVAALVAHTINMFCIANQMAPYLACFITLVLFAKLAFVDGQSSIASDAGVAAQQQTPAVGSSFL